MKVLKNFIAAVAISLVSLSFSSCGNKGKSQKVQQEQVIDADKKGKEYTADYICPMHCNGSGSDKPGECPVCGMDYKKNDKNQNEKQNENHSDHGDHSGHNH